MSIPDWLLLAVQWVHHLGAVAWVGGNAFYMFVLRPAFRTSAPGTEVTRSIGQEFRGVVYIAIIILVITGVIISVAHLGAGGNSPQYIGILALKIALAVYMFLVVLLRRRSGRQESADSPVGGWRRVRGALTSTTALLILGVAIIGLADVLGALHGSGGHGSGGHSAGGHSEAGTTNGAADSADGLDHHSEPEEPSGGHSEAGTTNGAADSADGLDHHSEPEEPSGGDGEDPPDAGSGEGDDGSPERAHGHNGGHGH